MRKQPIANVTIAATAQMLQSLSLLSNVLVVTADVATPMSDETVVFAETLDPAQIETREFLHFLDALCRVCISNMVPVTHKWTLDRHTERWTTLRIISRY